MSLRDRITAVFGEEENEDKQVHNVPEWMAEATQHSRWAHDGVISKPSFYWYDRASKTAPEYETPILSDDQRKFLKYDYYSAYLNNFSRDYQVNEDITIRTQSDEPRILRVEIHIDDFEQWASTSRLHQGFRENDSLRLAGKFYVELLGEIDAVIGKRGVFFEAEKPKQLYSLELFVPDREIERIM